DYRVLIAQLSQPPIAVTIKLAGPEAPYLCSFERTAVLHRLVAQHTTIPISEVLAIDTSYVDWPWRYLITTFIPGDEWATARKRMNQQELANAYRQMGRAVAQLHAIRFAAFGELTQEGTVYSVSPYLKALQERSRLLIKSEKLCDLFLSLLESKS